MFTFFTGNEMSEQAQVHQSDRYATENWFVINGENKFNKLWNFKDDISPTVKCLHNPKSYTLKLLKQVCISTGVSLKDAIEFFEDFEQYQKQVRASVEKYSEELRRKEEIRTNRKIQALMEIDIIKYGDINMLKETYTKWVTQQWFVSDVTYDFSGSDDQVRREYARWLNTLHECESRFD
jgi:hypothetical protein